MLLFKDVCSIFEKQPRNQGNTLSIKWIPPNPAYYTIEEKKQLNKKGTIYQKCDFFYRLCNRNPYPWIKLECYQLQKITTKKKIILLHISNINSSHSQNNSTIIVSHNSTSDIGKILPLLIDMSSQLQRNIVSYDYTGYGQSEGEPKIKEIYTDIDQVLDFCTFNLKIKNENIILLGQSAGAIPSIYIASQETYCSIRGIILISPFVIDIQPAKPKKWFNINNTEEDQVMDSLTLAPEILCSVFLIGIKDNTIPLDQSQDLKKKLRNCFEWYPSKGDNRNIFTYCRKKTYKKLRKYIYTLEEDNHKKYINLSSSSCSDISNDNGISNNISSHPEKKSSSANLSIELKKIK